MPMSSTEGKAWLRARVDALAARAARPLTVVDVGPGVGTYAKLLHDLPIARMIGIEAWEPYIETYRLGEYYDEIIVGDAREVDFPPCDVVIFGDVLEHMTREDGVRLWQRAAEIAKLAEYLSIPIVHYPQHEIEGNPYEVHVEEDWSHAAVLDHFAGVGEYEVGTEVGAYERLIGR